MVRLNNSVWKAYFNDILPLMLFYWQDYSHVLVSIQHSIVLVLYRMPIFSQLNHYLLTHMMIVSELLLETKTKEKNVNIIQEYCTMDIKEGRGSSQSVCNAD